MNESDKTLIVKYITGQADEDESALVKYLIDSSSDHERFYVETYEAWQRSLFLDDSAIDTSRAWNAVKAKMELSEPDTERPRFKSVRMRSLTIAASIALVCVIGVFAFRFLKGDERVTADHQIKNAISVPKGMTFKTVLSDGTKVWINAGSVLRLDQGFGETSRTVFLNGEAYFDIAKNALPFIVETERHTIRDIGTIFNVKAYSDDLTFETAVIEGEVYVEKRKSTTADQTQIVSVKKQQVLKLNYIPAELEAKETTRKLAELQAPKIQEITSSQVGAYTGWTEDLLVFEGKTFGEITRIMERRYDVDIVIKDPQLSNYEYTGSFKHVSDIAKALQILKETTAINYDTDGRVITIWGNEPSNELPMR